MTREKHSHGKTNELLERVRAVKTRLEMTIEDLTNELNLSYLHRDDEVSVHCVTKWMAPNCNKSITSESAIALFEWLNKYE